jgi:molybdate transport system substrate-binding protein
MMWRSRLLGLICLWLPSGVFAVTLHIAVAANVQFAFEELATAFTRETGIQLTRSSGSSGKLSAQIQASAPFDVFLSADMEYPAYIYKSGLAANPPEIYAYGTLVLWTFTAVDLSTGLAALRDQHINTIGLPNPKLAPYGREAMRALAYYHLAEELQPKLILGESIAQVNQYITSRSTEIGFTAKSVVLAPQLPQQGRWIDVPKEAYTPIAQGAVLLTYGQHHHPQAAQRFMTFLQSPTARAILQRYGYGLP